MALVTTLAPELDPSWTGRESGRTAAWSAGRQWRDFIDAMVGELPYSWIFTEEEC